MTFSAEQMFDLVVDVESYPSFLPWCVGAQLHERDETQLVASLSVLKAGFRQTFTTRNTLNRPQSMKLELVSGPFKSLEGDWSFVPLRADGCKISLRLAFRMSGPLGRLLEPLFEDMAESMVDAFVSEARKRYRAES